MSDFFSDIYQGIRQPDVVMNRGPLPPTSSAGMPPGYDGTPDAKIDYASTLLGDLDPYAYGEPGRPGTQAAYLNIPHVAQRIVPQINLPEPQPSSSGGGFFGLNHQVDDGDVAFVIRAMFSPFDLVDNKSKYNRQGILYAIDPIANLSTVNYILHGLQRFGFNSKEAKNWNALWLALGIDHHFEKVFKQSLSEIMTQLQSILEIQRSDSDRARKCSAAMYFLRRMLCKHIIKDIIKPFGVPRGSEKQGGQHQGIVNKAVTYPVDFVTAMVIDGKVINLVNFWRQYDISAGDDLMLHLEELDVTEYVLSHHPKSRRTQAFPPLRKWFVNGFVAESMKPESQGEILHFVKNIAIQIQDLLRVSDGASGLWEESTQHTFAQMGTRSVATPMDIDGISRSESIFQLVPAVSSTCRAQKIDAVWVQGYWHIARSQVMQFSYDTAVSIANGAHTVASGKLLEATFEPVWVQPLQTDVNGEAHDVVSFRYDDAPVSRKRKPLLDLDKEGSAPSGSRRRTAPNWGAAPGRRTPRKTPSKDPGEIEVVSDLGSDGEDKDRGSFGSWHYWEKAAGGKGGKEAANPIDDGIFTEDWAEKMRKTIRERDHTAEGKGGKEAASDQRIEEDTQKRKADEKAASDKRMEEDTQKRKADEKAAADKRAKESAEAYQYLIQEDDKIKARRNEEYNRPRDEYEQAEKKRNKEEREANAKKEADAKAAADNRRALKEAADKAAADEKAAAEKDSANKAAAGGGEAQKKADDKEAAEKAAADAKKEAGKKAAVGGGEAQKKAAEKDSAKKTTAATKDAGKAKAAPDQTAPGAAGTPKNTKEKNGSKEKQGSGISEGGGVGPSKGAKRSTAMQDDEISQTGKSETPSKQARDADLKNEIEKRIQSIKAETDKIKPNADLADLKSFLRENIDTIGDTEDGRYLLYYSYPMIYWASQVDGDEYLNRIKYWGNFALKCHREIIETLRGKIVDGYTVDRIPSIWLSSYACVMIYNYSLGLEGRTDPSGAMFAVMREKAQTAAGMERSSDVQKDYKDILQKAGDGMRCSISVSQSVYCVASVEFTEEGQDLTVTMKDTFPQLKTLRLSAFQTLACALTENSEDIVALLSFVNVKNDFDAYDLLRYICAACLAYYGGCKDNQAKECIEALDEVNQLHATWGADIVRYKEITEEVVRATDNVPPTTVYKLYAQFSDYCKQKYPPSAKAEAQIYKNIFKKISARNL